MRVSAVRTPPLMSPPPEAWTDSDAFSPTTDMYASHSNASASVDGRAAADNDNGDGGDDDDDEFDEKDPQKAIALRRQRNRESMRRTRLRAKETLTTLRATLARLEAQYAQLMAPSFDAEPASARRAFLEKLQTRLHQLVQLRRSLEAENAAVALRVAHKSALERELQQLLNEHALDEMVNEKLSLLGAKPNDFFRALSPAQVKLLITSFCDEVLRVKAAAHAMAHAPHAAAPLEVFGWQTHRHVDDATNEMHFEFTKRFDHISAAEMTQRAWAQGMDVDKFRATERHLHIRRLDFLQHVSSDVKVMVREIVHPVDKTVFRTNYLTFKIPTRAPDGRPAGFLVGMRSVNPPPPAECDRERDDPFAERVVWIDASVSIEFVARGAASCQVSWRGRTNYKSPLYAAESAVKFLMGVLRWEASIVGPLIQLVCMD